MNTIVSIRDLFALSPLLIVLSGSLLLILRESFTKKAKSISFHLYPNNLKNWDLDLAKAQGFDPSKKTSYYNTGAFSMFKWRELSLKFKTNFSSCLGITLATLVLTLLASYTSPSSENTLFTKWLTFDSLSRFFTIFFLIVGICSTLLASSFFQNFKVAQGEYYFFLLSTLFGLILIGASKDFLTLFIGLETLSISLYVWCGYMKQWEMSSEAAIKYFLLGSMATAFLLYGIALIYGAVGSTQFDVLLSSYQGLSTSSDKILFLSGITLVSLGLAFKAAIVPFHFWAPDVYDGAPTPVTAFMAVGTKAGAFAAFIRIFLIGLPQFDPFWNEVLTFLAYATLIYANIMALRQVQLRRFFAYSSISHSGFLLIPIIVGSKEAIPALLFYLVVYALATFGAFAVLTFLDKRSEGVLFRDLHGLFRRAPLLSSVFALCLLTLAGIPPTLGFFAKFYVLKLAFQGGYYLLVIVGLLTSILSAFYYTRLIAILFSDKPLEEEIPTMTWTAATVGAFSFIAILFFSFFPQSLLNLLAHAF